MKAPRKPVPCPAEPVLEEEVGSGNGPTWDARSPVQLGGLALN